jgi:hypothetical protein
MHIIGKADNPDDKQPEKHRNKRPYNIVTDYQPCGNKAIDQVAACIVWHQQRNIPLKAIHLAPMYYDWFRKGLEILQGAPLDPEQLMQMYSIDIEKGDKRQKTPILPERWVNVN